MSTRISIVVCVGLFSVMLAGRASAQSALTGVVKDDSGAVLDIELPRCSWVCGARCSQRLQVGHR